MIHRFLSMLAVGALAITASVAEAQAPTSSLPASSSTSAMSILSAASSASLDRQSPSDAWWTGSLLANGASTLQPGHFLLEPYIYDIISPNSSTYGSSAYVFYGLVNGLTVGVIPIVGYNTIDGGPGSSNIEIGDFSFLAQKRLTQYREGSWVPTMGFMLQETFPTGKYDQLGDQPSNGQGAGAYTTKLALNTQWYFWMPTGRILRVRFEVSEAFSNTVSVQDVSVYGTSAGFHGHAKPGASSYVVAAWEYSLTRRWVLALDAAYTHNGNTRVTGYNILDSNRVQDSDAGSSDVYTFAPAFEFNWKPNLGVIIGTRIVELGHNITPSIAPVMAINFVH